VAEASITRLPGVVDRHVHLGLVDREALARSAVVRVEDLGWVPGVAAGWRDNPPDGLSIGIAGPFHTAPGGYPSGRSWAPAGSVREVDGPAAAEDAVAALVPLGPVVVKIALHADMALLDDATLAALIAAARAAGIPTAVHAEGAGQAERAIEAGADVLVHVPWTHRLGSRTVASASGMTWISTLSIHGGDALQTALANARGFLEAGGRLRYGTDMGNGPTPVGVNADEIRLLGAAGLAGPQLLAAVLDGPDALEAGLPLPATAAELVDWLAASRRIDLAD
jgi:hypothetical protein